MRKPLHQIGISTMKPLLLAALALAAAAGAEPAKGHGNACPRWIAVLPLNEGNAESIAKDAAALGEETFVDGVAWICSVHPEGTPPTDKGAIYAERYREAEACLRKMSSVKQGVLLQSTMGHGSPPASPAPFQVAVPPNDNKTCRVCPLDREFLAYIARTCRTLNALKPDFFMVDDDTRLVWSPAAPGCFCPLHLAQLEKATGRAWTRQEVIAKLKSGDADLARTWDRIKYDSLAALFRTIRENFDADIPGILCTVTSEAHIRHVAEYAAMLAAPGQTPIIRGGGAPYHGYDDLHVLEMRYNYALQQEKTGRKAIFMHEADTCPQTLWACSAVREVDHLAMLALDGVKAGKIWIARTGNNQEKRSFEVYRREFREQRGIVEWAGRDDFRMSGVVLPIPRKDGDGMFFRYLGQTGIPFRFGRARPGDVVALDGPTVQAVDEQTIGEALSGPLLLDAAAAVWLASHGHAADIGVDAKAWNGPSIQLHAFADGKKSYGRCPGGPTDLSALRPGAEPLSWLFNRPRMGAEPRKVAPGSVLFRNARGGTVLTLAATLPAARVPYNKAQFYSETYRDELVKGLARLGGGRLPGGACYLGVGSVTCVTGTTSADGDTFVLNILGGDEDPAPEMAFDAPPSAIERLGGDGAWRAVAFTRTEAGTFRLDSLVQPQRAAVFRIRANRTARELGERYQRTHAEEDRRAWMAALDAEGWNFKQRARSSIDARGVYKFNRESKLLCMVLRKTDRTGDSWDEEVPPDGRIHFEWTRKPNGGIDYRYSAPTNWDVFVNAYPGAVTRYGAKVVKARLGNGDPMPEVSLPKGWRIVEGAEFSGVNVREAYFTFERDGTNLPPPQVSVDWGKVAITSVRGAKDVSVDGAKARFTPSARKPPTSFSTSLPGFGPVSSSLSHHLEGMQAGPYKDYPFPSNEVKAVANFVFALREGFRRIGFDRKEAFDGSIWLGGFDSNFPNGHTDFPPHFHLIPSARDGTQVHHFYVNPKDGRITSDCYQDMSRVMDVWDRVTTFRPGDTFPAFDGHGRVGFRVKMLADGIGLEVAVENSPQRFRVAGARPCDSVDVLLPQADAWRTVKTVTVRDDPVTGTMETPEGTIRYDPSTGARR